MQRPATLSGAPPEQLPIPFLTAAEAGAIHAARDVVDRAAAAAYRRQHYADAVELDRLGDELVAIMERNAAAARAHQLDARAGVTHRP